MTRCQQQISRVEVGLMDELTWEGAAEDLEVEAAGGCFAALDT